MGLIANTDLYAGKGVLSRKIYDVFKSVMTAVGTLLTDPESAGGELNVVVDYDDLFYRNLVEVHGLNYRLPREVHIGGGL